MASQDDVADRLVLKETAARRPELDALRVVGIVAIVAGHVASGNELVRQLTFSWHVPVFFVLSGYLWSPSRGVVDDLKGKARTLLRPYFAWLLLVTVVYWLATDVKGDQIDDLALGGSYIDVPYSAFWFVTALFCGSLLYRALPTQTDLGRVATGLGALAAGVALGDPLTSVPESAGVAVGCLFFVAVGDLLRLHRGSVSSWVGVATVPLLTLFLVGVVQPLDLKEGVFGAWGTSSVAAASLCVSLIVGAEWLMPRLPTGWEQPTTAFARVGLVIVLTHALVLLTGWSVWPSFVVGLFVPLLVGLLIERTRVSPILLGR